MTNINDYINAATSREEIRQLMRAIGGQESGGKTEGETTLNKDSGAAGPFQVMPATARGMGFKGTDAQLRQAAENAKWAAKYLEEKFDTYKGNVFDTIASYYQGDNERGKHGGYAAPAKKWASGVVYPSADDYVAQVAARMGLKYTSPGVGYADTISGEPKVDFQPADRDAIETSSNADIDKFQAWMDQQKLSPEVTALFEKALQDTDKSQGPTPRPVPNRPSLGGRLLSSFAGGLATNLSGNPQYKATADRTMAQMDAEAKATEDENFTSQEDFRLGKQKRRQALMDSLFEYQVKDHIKKGDVGSALKTMLQEEKIKSQFKAAEEKDKSSRDEQKQAAMLDRALKTEEARGEERRKTLDHRVELRMKEEGMTKDEAMELEKGLDGVRDSFKEYLRQMSPMEGGEGIDGDKLAEVMAAQAKALQLYGKKYREALAAGKPKPAVPQVAAPVMAVPPAGADSSAVNDSTVTQPQVAAPKAPAESPSDRVRRKAAEIAAAKAAATGGQ
jgi:hypothetical protein